MVLVKNHEFHIQPPIHPDSVFQIRYWNIRSGSELRNGMDGAEYSPSDVLMGSIIQSFRAVDSLNVCSDFWNHHSRTHDRLLFLRFVKGSGRCIDGMVAKSLVTLELPQGSIKQLHAAAGERSSLSVCSYPGCNSHSDLIHPWSDNVYFSGFSGITHKLSDCTGSPGAPSVRHWICDLDCNTVSRIRSGQGYACRRVLCLGGHAS